MTFRLDIVAIGVMSSGMLRLPFLAEMAGMQVKPVTRASVSSGLSGIAGWGCRPAAREALVYAKRHRLPYWAFEDGFLRSYGTGDRFPPLSIVVDGAGIYYDSTRPSALEGLLASSKDLLASHEAMVDQAFRVLLEKGLSKYNHAPDGLLRCFVNRNDMLVQRVLVVDQTAGDMSVSLGGASAQTFADMLAAAKAENPQATIYVKTHPEVSSGRKGGYLTLVQPDARTVLLRDAVNPMSLLKRMDKVYVVTSTMGFEALLAGKPVVCFGVPWYAGWGATDDRCADSPAWGRRTRQRNVRELFAAAYVHYTRYLDPVTHQRGSILDVVGWLVRQKKMATLTHGAQRKSRVLGVGFRRWKAANLKPMLGLHQDLVSFLPNVDALQAMRPQLGDRVVCWGATPPAGLAEQARQCRARLLHVEDGFVRSVGLGSDLIRPQSLVLDERGIYFDATRPSDLEVLLASRNFSVQDLSRARAVRAFIVEHGITKYNLEPREPVSWGAAARASGRTVVLVPGQVEDDASIRLGCTTVHTNLALLQAVRAAQPDAFIVYKPHPDVLSGNRKGRLALQAARRWADQVEVRVSVVSCIEACDEVHTMTSLTGFDALLRGKLVVTYGQPFYAGWGLTQDRAENATAFFRRQRNLSLDELVAGALLHYPIYWDWDLKGYTTCEAVLNRILEERTALEEGAGLESLRTAWLRRQGRKLAVLCRAWTQKI